MAVRPRMAGTAGLTGSLPPDAGCAAIPSGVVTFPPALRNMRPTAALWAKAPVPPNPVAGNFAGAGIGVGAGPGPGAGAAGAVVAVAVGFFAGFGVGVGWAGTGVAVGGTAVAVAVAVGGTAVAVAVLVGPGGGGGGGTLVVAVGVAAFAVTAAVVICCVLLRAPLMQTFAFTASAVPVKTAPGAMPTT